MHQKALFQNISLMLFPGDIINLGLFPRWSSSPTPFWLSPSPLMASNDPICRPEERPTHLMRCEIVALSMSRAIWVLLRCGPMRKDCYTYNLYFVLKMIYNRRACYIYLLIYDCTDYGLQRYHRCWWSKIRHWLRCSLLPTKVLHQETGIFDLILWRSCNIKNIYMYKQQNNDGLPSK